MSLSKSIRARTCISPGGGGGGGVDSIYSLVGRYGPSPHTLTLFKTKMADFTTLFKKRAMKIIYPQLSYAKALELAGLSTLYDRREAIAAKLFNEICANQSHSLHKLLPSKYQPSYYLREQRTFIRPKCKTARCKNSFPLSYVYSN